MEQFGTFERGIEPEFDISSGEEVDELAWFCGACSSASFIQTSRQRLMLGDAIPGLSDDGFKKALTTLVGPDIFGLLTKTCDYNGGVMWSPGKGIQAAWCGEEEEEQLESVKSLKKAVERAVPKIDVLQEIDNVREVDVGETQFNAAIKDGRGIIQKNRFVQERECCNAFKCPLPFAIPGSTGFQYRVQAQAIAATLTDSCYSNSQCLNPCKTRLQTGFVDPVAQARARAIVGARR